MHVRKKLVAGNWKMNGSRGQLAQIGSISKAAAAAPNVDVAICPPFTLLAPAADQVGDPVLIGAQDCHARASGAHTGCTSVSMIKEAGARMVIVGHSERRADQHETDEDVRAKAQAALEAGLLTIVCVGETADEREAGRQLEVVTRQLRGSLPDDRSAGELVIAYEPVWAIGTGKVATPADVKEMHAAIRSSVIDRFGDEGHSIRILYGGSVKADNAAELFAVPHVDGALVGGASLTAEQFVPIIDAAAAAS